MGHKEITHVWQERAWHTCGPSLHHSWSLNSWSLNWIHSCCTTEPAIRTLFNSYSTTPPSNHKANTKTLELPSSPELSKNFWIAPETRPITAAETISSLIQNRSPRGLIQLATRSLSILFLSKYHTFQKQTTPEEVLQCRSHTDYWRNWPKRWSSKQENTGFSMSYRIPCKNRRRKTITEEHRTPKTSTSAQGRRWVDLKKPNDDRERERGREGYRSGWPSHSLQRLCARRESGVEFLRLFLRLSVAVCPSVVTATATGFCCGFSVAKGWKGRQDSTKGLTQPIFFSFVAAAHSKYINSEP